MQKLFLPLAVCGMLLTSTTASAITFKEKYNVDSREDSRTMLRGKTNLLKLPSAAKTSDEKGLVTDPQGTKTRYAMATDIFLSNLGATHVGGFGAEVVTSDDGSTFASRAFTLNFFQQGYSVGEIRNDSVIFHSGEYIYNTADGEKANMYAAYMAEGEEWPEVVDTFFLTKDDKGRYVSEPGYYFIVMTEEEMEGGINDGTDIICFGTNYVFTPLPENVAEDSMPADAEVFDCTLMANSLSDQGESIMKDVTVGVSGKKVYISGLCDYLPDCYLVGEIEEDNIITFNTHQYIDYFDEGEYPYIYEFSMVNPLYFNGESLAYQEVESVTMWFNEEKTQLTLEDNAGIFNNAYGDITSWNEVYWGMMFGNFNQAVTPTPASDVQYYDNGTPYLYFDWNNISEDGLPLMGANLWCEVYVNGEPFIFTPEYYEGLKEPTDRVYYNTSGVKNIYTGDYTTIYFNQLTDNTSSVKTIAIRTGYHGGGETRYSDLVYATGYEPFEDKAFVPSAITNAVYYKDYYNNFRFKFDGKDTEGNPIPARLLGVEILLDGKPLVFKDEDYYFHGGQGGDVTIISLDEYGNNYNASLISQSPDNEYYVSLWAHSELPEFKTVEIRPVCTGADTITYGEGCEIALERPATPADPWNVTFESDRLKFGALPIDTDGNGLAPWSYGYEVYVNDALYTFNSDIYELENDITVIPYEGFEYNYNFYLSTGYVYDEETYQIVERPVTMEVSMLDTSLDIRKIGVRAVYTDGEGNTTYSEVINSDGSTGTSGVSVIGNDNGSVRWYNLQGVEVAEPASGEVYIRRQNGKTTKVTVR